MMVLDASVLIGHLDGSDAHHEAADALLARAVDDDLGVNPLTLAEVLVAPARAGRMDTVTSALRDVGVVEVPFPADAAVRLAQLRAGTGLRMPDCCVLLAAEESGGAVASFDARLSRSARQRNLTVIGA